ncbi:ribonuclease HII [Croceivirga thetidis]|uniref:Ribonuclease HII n=1 Tax=Croceivirga thetidis TaxID=2721623 RepID=A0ABX1GPM5_9FLAO|nr:ribonuclease HII [Croceivirga thetidis]NKI31854.1 ribonuclease HII [Croceivirga thetidis]
MLSNKFKFSLEAGTDEAGRGCLAGPVTAAAIVLPEGFQNELLNDSKQLSTLQREKLLHILISEAVSYGVSHVYEKTIDEINILNASILAMHHSLDQLNLIPKLILVDGNRFKPYKEVPYECIIKGDGKFMSIAAASILAKTSRDAYMKKIHEEFPMYHWDKNKGYPTKDHRDAIRNYGPCKYHRQSFRLLPEQLKLDL